MDAVQVVSVDCKCMKGQACEAMQVASCWNYKSDVVWWWQVTSFGSGPAAAILETAIAMPQPSFAFCGFRAGSVGPLCPMTVGNSTPSISAEQRVRHQHKYCVHTANTQWLGNIKKN